MKKYPLKEKKRLLARIIELHVLNGFDICPFLGKSYSYFNYEEIEKDIEIAENNDLKLIM